MKWLRKLCGLEPPTDRTSAGTDVVLLNGKDYSVEVSESSVVRRNKSTGQTKAIDWSAITYVHVEAIDRFPIGGISVMLWSKDTVVEIPIESEGSDALLPEMQRRLKGFDSGAFGDSMAMLHGSREVWTREQR